LILVDVEVIKLETVLITYKNFKDFADQIFHSAIRSTHFLFPVTSTSIEAKFSYPKNEGTMLPWNIILGHVKAQKAIFDRHPLSEPKNLHRHFIICIIHLILLV